MGKCLSSIKSVLNQAIRPFTGILFCGILIILDGNTNAQDRRMSLKSFGDTTHVSDLLRQAKSLRRSYPDSALRLNNEALYQSKILNANSGIARALLSIGTIYFDRTEFSKSKIAFLQAAPFCQLSKKEHKTLNVTLYNNLGNIYATEGNIDSGFYYYFKALKEIENRGIRDSSLLLLVYSNIGGVLIATRQETQARYYLNKSAELARALKDTVMLAQNYINIGRSQVLEDSAQYHYRQALGLYQQQKHSRSVSSLYFFIGMSHGRQGDLKGAKKYFDSAEHADAVAAARNPDLQRNIGEVYFQLKDYPNAILYYTRALRLCEAQNTLYIKLNVYYSLAKGYDAMGNKAQAYTSMKSYADLQDYLMNEEKIKSLNQLEVKYRLAEKEKEIAASLARQYKQQNQLQQKNIWIIGSTGSCLLLLAISMGIYRTHRQKQKAQKEKINTLEQQQEVQRLQTIMHTEEQERARIARDLHDGMGVLLSASIMNYTVLGKPNHLLPAAKNTYEEGMDLLQEMRKEVRNIAYNLIPGMIAEKNLADATHNLAKKLQKNNPVQIEVQEYGTIVMLEPQLSFSVYRIVEELLNNALKHAEATHVLLQLIFHEQGLNLVIEDDGKGFDTGRMYDGMGLQNLKSRTAHLGASLTITSAKGKGTTAELEIPIKNFSMKN